MADLSNLLDEVDDALGEEEDEVEVPNTQIASYEDNEDSDDNDDNADREHVELPAALEEFEQQQQGYGSEQEKHDEADQDLVELETNENHHYYVKLKRLWQQELACPELLPLDEELVEAISDQIERQQAVIDDMGEEPGDIEALLGSVLKVDCDRAQFMLSDLLRMRLWKIQEHPLHMRDLVDRMSESEFEFLKGYGQLFEGYMRRTVLDHVAKDALKNLDEPEMIDKPDLEQFVFVRVKETSEIDIGTEDEPSIQQHDPGTTLITRYNLVRELFGQGKVELIL
ncbi:GINS protein SLD5 [Seminavis robusta]|uniref:DNA replication complex GINS protein SLD5 n=1 Tax=Seminavis robusta TaxID=568900 RepID=A0A9N8EWR4_9STRA|nr:GINS protein SLD5 [Seminavis robusta]|eukprot:Sro1926_g305890.1 GINS protein SLD5 (284) ;mRNA; f:10556-11488